MAGPESIAVDEDRPLDTSAIVRGIEVDVARRREAGEYPTRLLEALHADFAVPAQDEPPELSAVMTAIHPIEIHRRPRTLILRTKQLIRKMIAWYVQPIAIEQTRFNLSILHELRKLERRLNRVETPWRRGAVSLPGAAAQSWRTVMAARADAMGTILERAAVDSIVVLGDDEAIIAALREHHIALVDLPEDERSRVHDYRDPIAALEHVAVSSMGGIVLAGILPRLSAAELLGIVPMAAHALGRDGLLVIDVPDPRHPLAPRDPSAIDPAMVRWIAPETIGLLLEAAGLQLMEERTVEVDGAPGWRIIVARRVGTAV